ncbi:hypothetical protein EJ07DRAFT_153929 [Lizonia empirigonia]|nr:hypothetical protein EJ07DRAFT_153929 [Lizonia empirigonia]
MADPSYRAAQPGEFFCPAGGKWYVTAFHFRNGISFQPLTFESRSQKVVPTLCEFVGCCMADPCTNGCHGDSLRPAGRSTALDSQSPGGSCGGQTPFWTCEQAPTFWGCCNEDPCMNNSTCPNGKLEPTYWDRPDQYEYFKDLNILLSSTAPRSTAVPSSNTTSNSGSGSKPSNAVIGGAVGGSLAFVAIIAAVVFLLWRRKGRNRKQGSRNSSSLEQNKPEAGELASPLSAGTAPPIYSWDAAGNSPVQQPWAHSHTPGHEIPGEDSKDSPRSPFSELHSKSSLARIAELPGGTGAKELDTPDITPKPTHTEFRNDMAKRES